MQRLFLNLFKKKFSTDFDELRKILQNYVKINERF